MLEDRLIDPNFTRQNLENHLRARTSFTDQEAKYLATLIAGRYIRWVQDIEAVVGK